MQNRQFVPLRLEARSHMWNSTIERLLVFCCKQWSTLDWEGVQGVDWEVERKEECEYVWWSRWCRFYAELSKTYFTPALHLQQWPQAQQPGAEMYLQFDVGEVKDAFQLYVPAKFAYCWMWRGGGRCPGVNDSALERRTCNFRRPAHWEQGGGRVLLW